MKEEKLKTEEETKSSPLYSTDLAPIPFEKRTWSVWGLTALWIGMAVCIPTYILASYMIKTGISWYASLIIIGLANIVITLPMVLNGHAGVKYGIPFPVIGRSCFGINGIHLPAFLRALVACGWFGIQTWIGGLAIYAIWKTLLGEPMTTGLDFGKFVCFFVFWVINIYFIWKGTESIKWLEEFSAPILIIVGILLIIWGAYIAGGFGKVLENGKGIENPTATLFRVSNDNNRELILHLNLVKNPDGKVKVTEYKISYPYKFDSIYFDSKWTNYNPDFTDLNLPMSLEVDEIGLLSGKRPLKIQFRGPKNINSLNSNEEYYYSSPIVLFINNAAKYSDRFWDYILWFTAMVGFWATMSISISDITRFAKNQKDQIKGQFLGLPGTMLFYSFVGIFVTYAAVINFNDVLISEDAPWDPVSLLSKFSNPAVVIFAQIAMIIATLSTNIAANVIAPANAFSNMFPKSISFRMGGVITGLIGIVICPWWLMDQIGSVLIFVSGLLGPVLGIMLCDYFIIRKKELIVADLYKVKGAYTYNKSGINMSALFSLIMGVAIALIGKWIPSLSFLFSISWFTGFITSFILYYWLMKRKI